MGRQVDLLRSLPPPAARCPRYDPEEGPDPLIVEIARMYERDYFDGPRRYGYGGYRYDGRWVPVATDIIEHFGLRKGDSILDVGCAKGFLVRDLMDQGMNSAGIDISHYATVTCCEVDILGRLHLGTAVKLPFPDKSFDAVVSINTLHNLDPLDCMLALQEISRVLIDPTKAFVQVDSYRNAEEERRFKSWVLTAKSHGPPDFWLDMFDAIMYQGDYDWTIN